jgi:peptide/nickel transport system permease protein
MPPSIQGYRTMARRADEVRSAASAALRGGVASRAPWEVSVRRFRANRLALWSLYVIAILVLAALLAPLLAPYDPIAIGDVMATRFQSPSWAHPFGTDEFGRDLFSRALYGARVSLSVGILAMLLATSIGSLYGAISGYFGGIVDGVMMRIVDVWIAFPAFYLMLLLVGVFEASVPTLILILALTAWPATARFIRAEILSLRERDYVEAARAMGLPAYRIIVRHVIPGALSPVLVTGALAVAGMIGAEAGLSFLGLGISPPTPSWGNMVAAGKDALASAWWISFFPGALLTITLIAFSLVADGLRDALDPKALDQKYV